MKALGLLCAPRVLNFFTHTFTHTHTYSDL